MARTTHAKIPYGRLRWLVATYYAIQDHRIKSSHRKKGLVRAELLSDKESEELTGWISTKIQGLEVDLKKQAVGFAKKHHMYIRFVAVPGIGETLASALIAYIGSPHPGPDPEDMAKAVKAGTKGYDTMRSTKCVRCKEGKGCQGIEAYDTASALWKHVGLAPVNGRLPRPVEGTVRGYSNFMRTLCWRIGESFVRTDHHDWAYKNLYGERKTYLLKRAQGGYECKIDHKSKGVEVLNGCMDWHIDRMARWYAVKAFLADAWEIWRKAEGYDAPDLWVHAHGGHVKRRGNLMELAIEKGAKKTA